jgi:hypothetical protein
MVLLFLHMPNSFTCLVVCLCLLLMGFYLFCSVYGVVAMLATTRSRGRGHGGHGHGREHGEGDPAPKGPPAIVDIVAVLAAM